MLLLINQSIEIKVIFGFICLAWTWNIGMVEYWNVYLKKMLCIYKILCQDEFYNNPISHFPK